MECSTKQGYKLSLLLNEGERCHETDSYLEKSRCHLGKCKNIEDGLDYPRSLFIFKISILRATVPKKFKSPDAMISVKIKRFGDPLFHDGDLLCHTNVIKNTHKPKWDHFTCTTPPLKLVTVLTFIATEHDGAEENVEFVGKTSEQIEYLLDRGPTKLYMEGPHTKASKSRHYIQVSIKGQRFKRPSETRKNKTWSSDLI